MDLETLAAELVKLGYYPRLYRYSDCWVCDMLNVEPTGLATGTGPTALAALTAANEDRKRMEGQPCNNT